MIRKAVATIRRDKLNIRDQTDIDRVLASLDDRIEFLSLDERRDLIIQTVAACEQAGIKIALPSAVMWQ